MFEPARAGAFKTEGKRRVAVIVLLQYIGYSLTSLVTGERLSGRRSVFRYIQLHRWGNEFGQGVSFFVGELPSPTRPRTLALVIVRPHTHPVFLVCGQPRYGVRACSVSDGGNFNVPGTLVVGHLVAGALQPVAR